MKSRIKSMYDAQLVENASLRARLAAALEDSARIDWLDENMSYVGGGDGGTYSFKTPVDVECGMLRAAIDEAMKL